MVEATCINVFRSNTLNFGNKYGKIVGYELQDDSGKTMHVTPEQLKEAIANNKILIRNMTLTSDNRLVTKKIKASCKIKESSVEDTERINNLTQSIIHKLNKYSDAVKQAEDGEKAAKDAKTAKVNAVIELKSIVSNDIVYQAFRASKTSNTTYEQALGVLGDTFYNGGFIVSYVKNIRIGSVNSMDIDEIYNIVREMDVEYSNLRKTLEEIRKIQEVLDIHLKKKTCHPEDFLNYMYYIHSKEIEEQTERMCNNGGWDFVTARSNARRNVINSYYTDDNTRTYYDLCTELIKNFFNIFGGN